MTDSLDQYETGLDRLSRHLRDADDSALPEATTALRSAVASSPDSARCWATLGYALDAAGDVEGALASLRRAQALDPDDEVVEVFVLTLFSELGPENEALAALEATSKRRGIDLQPLRADLREAGFPVDSDSLLRNGFLHARNFLRSRIEDEIDEAQDRRGPVSSTSRGDDLLKDCLTLRAELRSRFDSARLPEDFKQVVPWALRLGIGDDACRSKLVEALADVEREELLELVRTHAADVHAWLDSFGGGPMPAEAAACMYLLLAVEEASWRDT